LISASGRSGDLSKRSVRVGLTQIMPYFSTAMSSHKPRADLSISANDRSSGPYKLFFKNLFHRCKLTAHSEYHSKLESFNKRQLLISTPSQLTELDVERQLKNCHWDFEIELAMNIAGVVEVVETPEAEQRGSEETVWACICHIAVNLSPWEPLRKTDYDPDNTLPLVSRRRAERHRTMRTTWHCTQSCPRGGRRAGASLVSSV
jgi:hypothetical protein